MSDTYYGSEGVIRIAAHFLSVLNLEFSIQFNSKPQFLKIQTQHQTFSTHQIQCKDRHASFFLIRSSKMIRSNGPREM